MPKKRKPPKRKPTAPPPADDPLTPGERRFVSEFLKDQIATHAYRRAFPGCAYTTARTNAARMLANANIAAEIAAARADLRERCREDAVAAISELGLIAFSRITDLVDFSDPRNPVLKPQEQIPPDAWAAVKEVSFNQFGVKVKMADKQAPLVKVLERLGLLQPVPALEALIALLPPELADQLRAALAAALRPGPGAEGAGGG